MEKIRQMQALNEQILLTKEFMLLKNKLYLAPISAKAEDIPVNNKIDLIEEEELLLKEVKARNRRFINKRKAQLFKETSLYSLEKLQENNKLVLKPKSYWNLFRQFIIASAQCLLPFKQDFVYLQHKANSTLIVLFQILRLMFIISLFSCIIFLYLIVTHLLNQSNPLASSCKYGFPCAFLYSSFLEAEGKTYSITLSVWIVFMFFTGIIYFYIELSEYHSRQAFIRKASIVSQYVFSSWAFHINNEPKATYEKERIIGTCQDYLKEEKYKKKIKLHSIRFHSYFCLRLLTRIVSWITFIIILSLLTIGILMVYKLRSFIRSLSVVNGNALNAVDIIGDIIPYIAIPILLVAFPLLCRLLPLMELFPSSSMRNKHILAKSYLANVWGLSVFIAINILFNIEGKTLNDILKVNISGLETFGCPGHSTLHTDYTVINNYSPINTRNYSQCREEEVGFNFLYVAIGYVIVYLLKDLLEVLICSCCRGYPKMIYSPYDALIAIFTMIVLFTISVPFIPYCIVLLPVLLVIVFKFEILKVRRISKGNWDTFNSIKHRDKSRELLFVFLFVLLKMIGGCLALLLLKLPHSSPIECVMDASSNVIMFISSDKQCGPILSSRALSELLTISITETLIISDVYAFLSEPIVIIIALISLICPFAYSKFKGKEYQRSASIIEKDLIKSLRATCDHLIKRDVITSILLKMSKKRSR